MWGFNRQTTPMAKISEDKMKNIGEWKFKIGFWNGLLPLEGLIIDTTKWCSQFPKGPSKCRERKHEKVCNFATVEREVTGGKPYK